VLSSLALAVARHRSPSGPAAAVCRGSPLRRRRPGRPARWLQRSISNRSDSGGTASGSSSRAVTPAPGGPCPIHALHSPPLSHPLRLPRRAAPPHLDPAVAQVAHAARKPQLARHAAREVAEADALHPPAQAQPQGHPPAPYLSAATTFIRVVAAGAHLPPS